MEDHVLQARRHLCAGSDQAALATLLQLGLGHQLRGKYKLVLQTPNPPTSLGLLLGQLGPHVAIPIAATSHQSPWAVAGAECSREALRVCSQCKVTANTQVMPREPCYWNLFPRDGYEQHIACIISFFHRIHGFALTPWLQLLSCSSKLHPGLYMKTALGQFSRTERNHDRDSYL